MEAPFHRRSVGREEAKQSRPRDYQEEEEIGEESIGVGIGRRDAVTVHQFQGRLRSLQPPQLLHPRSRLRDLRRSELRFQLSGDVWSSRDTDRSVADAAAAAANVSPDSPLAGSSALLPLFIGLEIDKIFKFDM